MANRTNQAIRNSLSSRQADVLDGWKLLNIFDHRVGNPNRTDLCVLSPFAVFCFRLASVYNQSPDQASLRVSSSSTVKLV